MVQNPGMTSHPDRTPARFPYGGHPAQFAELTLPSGPGPYPVVVVVHGGFWKERYDLALGRPLAADLAEAGVAAWNVEYRRVGQDGGGWPGTVDDVYAAVDALGAVAEGLAVEHGAAVLDLSRVAAVGHSAGGHLAALLAARTEGLALTGVVSQAGVLDLEAAARDGLGDGATQRLLGGGPDTATDRYAAASPTALLPFGVPISCVHGDHDQDVPVAQSVDFVRAARAAGDIAELIIVPGADHFAMITVTHPAWITCREAALRLLGP